MARRDKGSIDLAAFLRRFGQACAAPVAPLLARLRRSPVPAPVNRRSTLHDLHRSGIVRVFRRPSIARIWEPLREHPKPPEDSVG